MKHRSGLVMLAVLLAAPAQAQQGQGAPDDSPLTEASNVPMTYVGGSGRISIGFDKDGNNQGDATGVFASNGERAVVAQLWWKNGGAGGLQVDYNWLVGMTAAQLRENPQDALVAKASFALDRNESRDRKATVAFGLERNDYFLNTYLSTAASSGRAAGALIDEQQSTLNGTDPIGTYAQIQTIQELTPLQSKPYRYGVGFRLGRFWDRWTLRASTGLDYEQGSQGAHETRLSGSLDKYLGQRGWSAAAQAEHSEIRDAFGQGTSDNRLMLMLRYEFGGQGAFVPRDKVAGAASVARALRSPTSGHSRTVNVYKSRKGSPTSTTTLGPRQYINRTPIVGGDSIVVTSGSAGTTIDVLANDSDPEGQTLQIVSVSSPAHGTAQIVGNQILYTPAAGYFGADSFSYTVSDAGGLSATGSVSVAVQQVTIPNRPPVARDDTASTRDDAPLSIAVLGNDADPDGDTLTITAVTPASSGATTQISGTSILYTPRQGFVGTDRFDYTISDGRGGTDSAQVSVTVRPSNRPPLAVGDGANAISGFPTVVDVLGNDSDPDGDALNVTAVSFPGFGTAIVNVDNTITYTPNTGFIGTDTFDYTISDGRGGSATASVVVSVSGVPPVNTPPIAVNDVQTVPSGTPTPIDVLTNDSDPDGDPLTVISVTPALFGNVVLTSAGVIIYSAPAGATGLDRFNYTISDGHGGTATAQVDLVVF
ncbi:MAG: cadherin-like domain-containing protein [Tahibacter sp.]